MGKSFVKPVCEIVRFTHGVIATSICNCNIGGFEMPGGFDDTCTSINSYCDCQTNTIDETAENCIVPGA